MKKTRIAISALILILVAGMAFASGASERPTTVDPGRRYEVSSDDATVTGELAFVDGHPVLVTDSGTYSISTRRGGLLADELVAGSTLTLSGETIDALADSPSGADRHMFVDGVVADGRTIDLDDIEPRGWSHDGGNRYRSADDDDSDDDDSDDDSRGRRQPSRRSRGRR